MNKTYVYKWFSGQSFVGVLDKSVISQFRYNQEINSAGSQIEIELGISLQDAAPSIDTDTLVDEDGNEITDDALNTIVTRLDYTVAEIPALNDRIEVWEHSADYPNGKRCLTVLCRAGRQIIIPRLQKLLFYPMGYSSIITLYKYYLKKY